MTEASSAQTYSFIGAAAACALLFAALSAPATALGQSEGVRAAIRSHLAADPETAALPNEALEAMVEALAGEAEAQGLTEEDITFAPAPAVYSEGADDLSFAEEGELSAFQKTLLTFAGLFAFLGAGWLLVRWMRAPGVPAAVRESGGPTSGTPAP